MTSGPPEPKVAITGPSPLLLEIAVQAGPSPLLIPVFIQNLSIRGATVVVQNPWVIPDWELYRGRDCALRLGASGGQNPFTIKAKLAWSKFDYESQLPLSAGLHLANPSGEVLTRLSEYIIHSPPDIKGLWERYDQVQHAPIALHLVQHFYLAGLVLLAGGVVLQFGGSPFYKMSGWLLWLLGSLGIAGKVMRSFRQKRASQ